LNRGWEKVKATLSNGQIREFYTFVANLWPLKTNVNEFLPEPNSSLRALYLGEYEPELMLPNVFRFCLYADQILLTHLCPSGEPDRDDQVAQINVIVRTRDVPRYAEVQRDKSRSLREAVLTGSDAPD
jgi:hypothetical protein